MGKVLCSLCDEPEVLLNAKSVGSKLCGNLVPTGSLLVRWRFLQVLCSVGPSNTVDGKKQKVANSFVKLGEVDTPPGVICCVA